MKCPKCNGRGAVQIAPNVKGLKRCPVCDGSGEVSQKPQTNEEWLRNLSFNEFARVLYCMIINGERIRPDLAYIKEWLKQPHADKE